MNKSHMIRPVIAVIVLSLIGAGIWWFTRPGTFYYAGTVEGTEITLSARVASVISDVMAKEGDVVQSGQVLMKLSGEDIRLTAALADKELTRAQRLLRSGALTQANFDKIRFEQERAALALEWCTIRAPQEGRVEHLFKEAGELVAPGMQLLTLTDIKTVWAIIYVEQPKLSQLSQGMTLQGFLPEMPGKTFAGHIAMIRNEAEFTPKNVQTRNERARLVYGVKVLFDNPEGILKPGMTIEMKLPEGMN